jgi:hypothetical protein
LVGRVRPLLVFNTIQVVGPHRESTGTGRTAKVTNLDEQLVIQWNR